MEIKEIKAYQVEITGLGDILIEKRISTGKYNIEESHYVLKIAGEETYFNSQEEFNTFKELVNKF